MIGDEIYHIFDLYVKETVLQGLLSPASPFFLLESNGELLSEVEEAIHGGCESTLEDLIVDHLT